MKVIVPTNEKKLDTEIAQGFGMAKYYLLVDSETKDFKALKNPKRGDSAGLGITAAQLVADKGVKAVIAINLGPKAFPILRREEVKIYTAEPGMSAEKAVELFEKGELEEMEGPGDEEIGPGQKRGPQKGPSKGPKGTQGFGRGASRVFRRVSM